MVKKNLFKYGSVLMCVVITAANLVACSNSSTESAGTDTAVMQEMAGNSEETIAAAINSELAVPDKNTLATNARQETVYVFGDASGKMNHITVNEKITDADGNETLNKTESKENVPVTMKVTYMLDGEEIKPENMAGKSGKVTIRFDYTNNQKKTVTIDGKDHMVAVPFTMITGMMLPADVYSNVEIINGKLTKVGDNIVALGMTMPGLSDTLNLKFNDEELDIDIPEYFEVTADVKNFSLDMTLSVATSNLLSDMDVDEITLDDLKNTVASMDDAATQLENGTVSLQEGTQKLNDSIPALTDGVGKLNSGAATLKEGIYAYADGAATAYEGAVSLNDNMKIYADGIGTLYDTLKNNEFDNKVKEAADGAEQLVSGSDSLMEGLGALTDGANQLKRSLENGMESAKEQYKSAYNSFYELAFAVSCQNTFGTTNVSNEQKQAVVDAMAAAGITAEYKVDDENQCGIATGYIMKNYSDPDISNGKIGIKTAMKMSLMQKYAAAGVSRTEEELNKEADTILTTISSGLSQAHQAYVLCNSTYDSLSTGGENSFFNGMTALKAGASQLNNGLKSLSTGLNTLSSSVGSFAVYREGTLCSSLYQLNFNAGKLHNEGTSALKKGLSELTSNNDSLKSGASQLTEGTASLKSNSETLAQGVNQLNAGAVSLKDGMVQFNKEAVEPISRLVNGDAQTALDTIKAVVKAGQEYNSFLGKSDDKEGSVTFVYKTAGITIEK
ncbi:MAG: hypothetical protein ACI4E1_05330 [Lachnospira sp.]